MGRVHAPCTHHATAVFESRLILGVVARCRWMRVRATGRARGSEGNRTTRLQRATTSTAAAATPSLLLNGRTRQRCVRTKDTAVARLRFEHGVAAIAFVEPLARIGGHDLVLHVTAHRARDPRRKDRFVCHSCASDGQAVAPGRGARRGAQRCKMRFQPFLAPTASPRMSRYSSGSTLSWPGTGPSPCAASAACRSARVRPSVRIRL